MATLKKLPKRKRALKFAQRIWHWRAKKYLYAKDYDIKGFPLVKR